MRQRDIVLCELVVNSINTNYIPYAKLGCQNNVQKLIKLTMFLLVKIVAHVKQRYWALRCVANALGAVAARWTGGLLPVVLRADRLGGVCVLLLWFWLRRFGVVVQAALLLLWSTLSLLLLFLLCKKYVCFGCCRALRFVSALQVVCGVYMYNLFYLQFYCSVEVMFLCGE